MFTWVKAIWINITNALYGLALFTTLSLVVLVAGIGGSIMCLFGAKALDWEQIRRAAVAV